MVDLSSLDLSKTISISIAILIPKELNPNKRMRLALVLRASDS